MPQLHIQKHFSQKFFGLCIDSNVFFHFRKRIQMHFLKYCRVYASTFTSRNAFQMLFFMVTVSTFKCIFSYCLVYASTQMYFFCFRKCIPNAHSLRLLSHSNELLSQCSFAHIRTRASARTRARTEQLSQMTPRKHFGPDMDTKYFLRTFDFFRQNEIVHCMSF